MKQLNPNIHPYDGYFFKDGDGTTHRGDSWAGVMARVVEYRKRQGTSAESVAAEVTVQACERNPVLCVEDNGATRMELKKTSMKTKLLQWLMGKRSQREAQELRFVSTELHAARTDVCIRCPRDKSMPGEGCGSCKAAVKEMKEAIVGNRETDGRISACPVLAEYLPVSTWLDEPAVDNPGFPQECWRKRTL
jgi:hypothetical protein